MQGKDDKDARRDDGGTAAKILPHQRPGRGDPEHAEDERRQPEEDRGMRRQRRQRVHGEEVQWAQLHAARTEGRPDEPPRLVDRIDLVLPEIEPEEAGQPQQCRDGENDQEDAQVGLVRRVRAGSGRQRSPFHSWLELAILLRPSVFRI